MDENRTDLFGENIIKNENEIKEPVMPEVPAMAENVSVSEEPQTVPITPVQKEKPQVAQNPPVQAAEPQTVQQKVESFYNSMNVNANGCTYAYARPQNPQTHTPPAQQPDVAPCAPHVQYSYYNAPQQNVNPSVAHQAQTPAKKTHTKKTKKEKKEKKPKNRMSFGQVFLCLALCLVVGSVSGYISSKAAVENALDAFKETLTTASTTGSYNINIYEQQPESAAPSVQTQQQTDPTVPVANSATASDIYKQNVNAVVNITAKGVRTVNYGFFFGSQQQEFVSSGSGFFLTEDGYILTNYHVVEGATTFIATDYDGKEHSAKLVGFEESNDIAVLKVNGTFQAVELGDSESLEVGDTLLIIGNALGELQYTLTQGVVSYLERAVTTETGSVINMFQTDAAINSGNSGGPVFNAKGEVVGIASAKYASSTIEGLGFCIPIDDVKYMISDIVNVGYVTGKPSVGVSLYTNTSRSNGLPYGCYIVAVEAGSAADNAGLDEGDVITAVDGKTVRDVDDFGSALSGKRAGDSITLTVYSADYGSSSQVSLTLDEYVPGEPRTDYTNVFDY